VANHLVDRIATLEETIEAAKARLRPGRHQRVRVVTYPPRPLLRLPGWLAGARALLGGSGAPASPESDGRARLLATGVVQQVIDHPGRPLLLVPSSLLPLEEEPIR
jgi:hypothetical protein